MMEARSNNLRLHFEVQGAGAPVLLVHGYPLSGRLWDDVATHLADDYRLIIPDLRGHGASEAAASATMEEQARDLMAVLDAADEQRPVVLVGMSMGGYVALAFCRLFWERVRGLVLVNSRAEADSLEAAEARRATAETVLERGAAGVSEVADSMVEKLFADSTNAVLRQEWRVRMAATDPVGMAAALRGMADRPDSTALLKELKVPMLMVGGEEDVITPAEGVRQMAEEVGAALEIIPGAGHMTPVERPAEVAEALREFLERVV